MGEKYYRITQFENMEDTTGQYTVEMTETELGRRLDIIFDKGYCSTWEKVFDILLLGIGEQSCSDADTATYQELQRDTGKGWKVHIDGAQEQPAKEKPRQWTPKQLAKHLKKHPECKVSLDPPAEQNEWEKWAGRMAHHITDGAEPRSFWFEQVVEAILTIPCRSCKRRGK